jgi:fumarate reductase subunit C
MVLLLAVMFTGIIALAHQTGLVYLENGPTLLYQLGERIFGNGPLLALLQFATLLILLLAANTAYTDFPRLAAFLARDGYLPRQLASLGDRLVFSNGIYALSGFAALLLIIFNGSVSRLIPLYAVGVFLNFSLSQSGMVVHWWREQGRGWQSKALVNGLGAAITSVVTVVLLFSKFTQGAWVVVIAIPVLVAVFLRIRTHYSAVSRRLRLASDKLLKLPDPPSSGGSPTVVLVGQLHRGSFEAIRFARTIASDLVAVHVDLGLGKVEAFKEQWARQVPDVHLEILDSPYRSLVDPVVDFVKDFEVDHRKDRNRFEAIRFARTIASDLVAVHVDLGLGKVEAFKEQWARQVPDVHLEILDSPYRSLVDPVVDFVKDFEVDHRKDRNRFCVVVLPVFVTMHRWENLLHNQSTILLRSALRAQGTRVVTTVGFYL